MSEAAPRVLVTRSEPGASETATRLRQAGFEPVVVKVCSVVATDPPDASATMAATMFACASASGEPRVPILSVRWPVMSGLAYSSLAAYKRRRNDARRCHRPRYRNQLR